MRKSVRNLSTFVHTNGRMEHQIVHIGLLLTRVIKNDERGVVLTDGQVMVV